MNKSYSIYFLLLFFSAYGCLKEEPLFLPTDFLCQSTLVNSHPDSTQFNQYLADKVDEGMPGISMRIETPAGVWGGAAGVADIPNKNSMTSCSIHRIGSITKLFTAVSILQLWEQGQLDIEDKISQHLAPADLERIENAQDATIRHLLSHTSGIADYTDNIEFWLDTYNDFTKVWTARDELAYVRDLEPEHIFDAGTQQTYSNTNYLLLGLIVEQVSGQTGEKYFQEHIFDPLDLDQTYFNQTSATIPGLVRSYHDEFDDGSLTDFTYHPFAINSMAGGIASNIDDLHTFLNACLTPGIVLTEQTISAMLEPTNAPFADPEEFDFGEGNKVLRMKGFGLGWITLETEYGVAIGHNGGLNGSRARMWYFPDSQSSLIYLMNGSRFETLSKSMFRNETLELIFE